MGTVTINPVVYERASIYARQHNISLSDLVERGLSAIMRHADEPCRLKTHVL